MKYKNSQVKWLSRFASIFIGIMVVLLIGEIVIRIFPPTTILTPGRILPPMYIGDEKLGWKLKSNFEGVAKTAEFSTEININSHGFRDYEHSSSNNESTFKILGLGDSFTFGYGVKLEETYLSLLEKYLNSSQNNNTLYEIFKTGIPGYSIKEEFILFEEYGLKIHPDLIIIGFDANDHTDCINPQPKYEVVEGYIVTRRSKKQTLNEDNISKFNFFLHKHSYFYSYLCISTKVIIDKITIICQDLPKEKFDKEKKERAWKCAADYLDRINKMAKADGAELLIIYIPHRSQVHPGLRQDRYIISEYFDNLDDLLGSFCKQNNIFYINLRPRFIKASEKEEQLYHITTDAHWNPNGHKLAARVIYSFLLNNNLLIKNSQKVKLNNQVKK